jgi:hypothetical protein
VKHLLKVASSPLLNPHYRPSTSSSDRQTKSFSDFFSQLFPSCGELLHAFVEKRDKEGHTAEYYATQKKFPYLQRLLAKSSTLSLPFELRVHFTLQIDRFVLLVVLSNFDYFL